MSSPGVGEPIELGELTRGWPAALAGRVNGIFVKSVDSTQVFARTLLDRHFAEDDTPHPFAVLALGQSGGRGRRGRPWVSVGGLGIWASLALPLVAREQLQMLPMRTGVALVDLVGGWIGGGCRLKWPNDLVVGRRKLGGILIDAVTRPDRDTWAVVGFGINHGHAEHQLPESAAISLRLAGGRALPPLGVAAGAAVAAVYDELTGERPWLDRYRAASAHAPGDPLECHLAGERLSGRFAGFDSLGFLRLSTAAGERVIASGEVFSW